MPGQDRILVVDPQVIRGILEPLVEAAGGQRAAARESKVGQTHLSRILNASAPYQLSEHVFVRLAHWVPRRYWRQLVGATMGWHERARLKKYGRWLAQRTGEENTGIVGVSIEAPVLEGALRHNRRKRLIEALRPRFRLLFRQFDTELDQAPARPGPARKALAYDRVLSPFYEIEEAGGIELGWEELIGDSPARNPRSREQRLAQILKVGMKREVLLLQRSPDSIRARRASSGDWKRGSRLKSLLQLTIPQMTPENFSRPGPHGEPFHLPREARGNQKPSEGAGL